RIGPLAYGLERNLHAAGIERGIGAVYAYERSDRSNVGVLQNALDRAVLALRHRAEGYGLRTLADGLYQAGVLLRKKPLGYHGIQQGGQQECAQGDPKRQRLMTQHPL